MPPLIPRLRELQRLIRQAVIDSHAHADRAAVTRHSTADTIYAIDAAIEPIIEDYCEHWGRELPMVVIAEGLEPETGRCFPENLREEDAAVRIILDPIDGTRGLMYDKRPAWSLAGVAPNHGPQTRLADIHTAVMTELPTSKMAFSDVLWAARGQGAQGEREPLYPQLDPDNPTLTLHASNAPTIDHGFATISSFFPGTKRLAAELMEHIAAALIGPADVRRATVFDDQYISTGGQFHELIAGKDRFNADLRPLFYRILNQTDGLCCHPYDCCTALVAREAGVIITDGLGQELDGPLDVTTGLSWAGFANAQIRQKVEPLIVAFLKGRLTSV